ncbi:unnamed protein product [Zymoseptoria tritici ST99CH_1E4]|uniref:Uncharacterized protein n=1 Tax=Zymoseptoria tritici ST99CH_1E4 TaxID=1276532 RepID=A0A2H1G6E6_ZYMTR|nr:unnamed protein product [Zymoseptoria tritici ST99CH_1E4]
MLSSSQINQSGALAEWLTRCPAMLQDRVDRQFLRERVFESHRRRENSIPQFFYHFDGHPQGVAQRRCASLMS